MATTTKPSGAAGAHAHDAHADHGHGRELLHHFETAAQQKEAATLGMWAFLVTEVMLFGGIFMAYAVYRWAFPDVWAEAAHHLNTPLGTVNTVVLLVSSLAVALSVSAAEAGNHRRVLMLLGVTLVLGVGFLVFKGYEYSEKFAHCYGYSTPLEWVTGQNQHEVKECLVPGRAFIFPTEDKNAPIPAAGQPSPHQLFYLLYFTATGLHAVHMLIGLSIVSWLAFITWRGVITTAYYTPIEIGGLYWHLIDVVWVFLFPLFYLVH
ncbi:MAG: cytochrome c oxidase subunit 3 family protein [Oscillochloridaceae bacterium umkhey_bin13]